MRVNVSNIVTAFVLFGLGAVIGGCLTQYDLKHEYMIKGFELLLGSTAVIIASMALNTWRTQFSHNEAFKCSIELESSFKKLLRASRKHWSESINLSRDHTQDYDREKLSTFTKQTELYLNYLDAWDNMSAHLSRNLNESKLKPEKLQSTLISFFVPIHRDHINDYNPETDAPDPKYHDLYKNGIQEIRGFRP